MNEKLFENFVILCDTREQKNKHITNWFDYKNIKHEKKKLDFGDYSFKLNGLTLENEIVIERKYSIGELCTCLTKDRDRFKREIIRAYEKKAFFILLIESGSVKDIENHNYRSGMHPNALKGSLKSWKNKYNIYTGFCNKYNTGFIMYDFFTRYILKNLNKKSIAI